jgi:hypothetical protein
VVTQNGNESQHDKRAHHDCEPQTGQRSGVSGTLKLADSACHNLGRHRPSPARQYPPARQLLIGWVTLICQLADSDWRLARVYFLAFLNPIRGQPVSALAARLASLSHHR